MIEPSALAEAAEVAAAAAAAAPPPPVAVPSADASSFAPVSTDDLLNTGELGSFVEWVHEPSEGPATPAGSLTPQRRSRRLSAPKASSQSPFGAISQSPFVAAASLPRSPAAMPRPASRASPRQSPRLSAGKSKSSPALNPFAPPPSLRKSPRVRSVSKLVPKREAAAAAPVAPAERPLPTPAAPAPEPTPKPAADPAMPPTSVVKAKAPAAVEPASAPKSTGPRDLSSVQSKYKGMEVKDIGKACELLKSKADEKYGGIDWEKRQAALNAVPALVADAAANGGLTPALERLSKVLAIQLDDLRSAIVRAACEALTAVAAAHGGGAAPLLALVLPQLFRNLYVTKKAISVASDDAAVALLRAVPTEAALQIVLAHAKDSHPPARRGAAAYLALLLKTGVGHDAAPPELSKGISLGAALVALISDKDAGVRTLGAKAYWCMHARWAGPAEGLMSKLEPAQQKLVKGNAPK